MPIAVRKMKRLPFILLLMVSTLGHAQDDQVKFALYDGLIIAGYVDKGGYLNFTGPNINVTYGSSKFILGMLPSLRFKIDEGTPRNAPVTPNLGVGLTYSYKIWAVQVPLYYNAKNATENGGWHVGVGLGLRLNEFLKKREPKEKS
jgi:hypothetical protein